MSFPPCAAVIVQLPPPVRCTVVPLTVQLPLAVKLTGRPEEAVALTVKSGSPKVLFARGPNVIVWSALAMLKVRATSGAGS